MTVTVQFPKNAKDYLGDGSLNLNSADLRMIPLLLTNSYTLNHSHQFLSDLTLSGKENTTNGAARKTLGSQSWALSGNNGRLDSADIVQTASGGSLAIGQYVMGDYTGSSADSDREFIALFTYDALATAGDGTNNTLQTPNGLFELQ